MSNANVTEIQLSEKQAADIVRERRARLQLAVKKQTIASSGMAQLAHRHLAECHDWMMTALECCESPVADDLDLALLDVAIMKMQRASDAVHALVSQDMIKSAALRQCIEEFDASLLLAKGMQTRLYNSLDMKD